MGIFTRLFPYTNLHELNLDWILLKVKESADDAAEAAANVQTVVTTVNQAQTTANQAITQAAAAQTTANRAQATANQAITQAAAAQTTANQAQATAENAADAAEQAVIEAQNAAGLEIIDVYGDDTNKTITNVNTNYSWSELCEKVFNGKVFFRLHGSNDSEFITPPAFPARIAQMSAGSWVNATIQIDSFTTNYGATADPDGIYIKKALINQNFGGTFASYRYGFPQ